MCCDVSRLTEIRGIEEVDDGLRIGAAATHSEIMVHPLIAQHAPALIDAAHTVGAVQTRNLGTLGGNLVTCVPSMDSGPALLALEAEVTIAGPDGNRRVTLENFFVGPRKTVLERHELLLDIIIPAASLGKPTDFRKFGLRKGQALALVNAASSLWVTDGKIAEPRIALGAVAPTVIRCREAEASLDGVAAGDDAVGEIIAAAAKIAVDEARPIGDFRASLEYRRDLIEVLTRRTLETALATATAR